MNRLQILACDQRICSYRYVQRLGLILSVGCLISINAPSVADVVSDKASGAGPDISRTENQSTRIDIQAPNEQGVSHNVYQRFDVEREGAVLNNSRDGADTELAGHIAGNPNLSQQEARTIINEINSRDPSRLNGMLEVAGQRADVIVANPSGITCSGCGFINSDRGVLTTGSPVMEDGRLNGFDVNRGQVNIAGAGLNGHNQKYTDIIARSVRINGKVQADNLRLVTGRNVVSAEHPDTNILTKAGKVKPAKLALDVRNLGGMYANRIYMVGTEQGVGVHNGGKIGQGREQITISNNGYIENEGHINGSDVVNIDTHGHEFDNGYGEIDMSSLVLNTQGGAFNNYQGRVEAGENLTFDIGDLDNTEGKLSGPLSMTLATHQIDNQSGLISGGKINIDTHGYALLNTGGDLEQENPLYARRGISGGNVKIKAGNIDNTYGRIGGRWLTLDTTAYANGLEDGDNDLLNEGGRIDAERSLSIDGRNDMLYNDNGVIQSSGSMTIHLNGLINGNGHILANREMKLAIDDEMDNEDGTIQGNIDPSKERPIPISQQ